jgi:hypothetical protein
LQGSTESLTGTEFGFLSLFFPILGRRVCRKRRKQPRRDSRDLIDRRLEGRRVGLRWFMEAADFSHELERRRPNLFVGDARIEIE